MKRGVNSAWRRWLHYKI